MDGKEWATLVFWITVGTFTSTVALMAGMAVVVWGLVAMGVTK